MDETNRTSLPHLPAQLRDLESKRLGNQTGQGTMVLRTVSFSVNFALETPGGLWKSTVLGRGGVVVTTPSTVPCPKIIKRQIPIQNRKTNDHLEQLRWDLL